MQLIKFERQEDYGRDLHLTILKIQNWCLLQSCFSTMVYGRSFPYLSLIFGSGRLFGFNFQVYKFGICIELLTRSWK